MKRVFPASSEFSARNGEGRAGPCTVEQSVERKTTKECITVIISFMVTESLLAVKVITVSA